MIGSITAGGSPMTMRIRALARSLVLDPLRVIRRNKMGFAGFLVLSFILLLSIVGPLFIPLDTKTKIDQIYNPPSWKHILGTDSQGRDIFSQIVHGGKDVLLVAFLSSAISSMIAVTFGSLSAFLGGRFDSLIMTVTDIMLTIPHFPLLSVLAAFVKFTSPVMLAVLLGLLAWPGFLRALRAQVLSLKERDYVQAARVLDLGLGHIIFREIMPNMMAYIAIAFILGMTGAVYSQVGLIMLGLVPFSGHNWGVMINLAWTRGAIFYSGSMSYILAPIAMIALFQWSMVAFTRSLEEVFNPRLRMGQ